MTSASVGQRAAGAGAQGTSLTLRRGVSGGMATESLPCSREEGRSKPSPLLSTSGRCPSHRMLTARASGSVPVLMYEETEAHRGQKLVRGHTPSGGARSEWTDPTPCSEPMAMPFIYSQQRPSPDRCFQITGHESPWACPVPRTPLRGPGHARRAAPLSQRRLLCSRVTPRLAARAQERVPRSTADLPRSEARVVQLM